MACGRRFSSRGKSKGRVRPHPNFEEGLGDMRVVQAVADLGPAMNG